MLAIMIPLKLYKNPIFLKKSKFPRIVKEIIVETTGKKKGINIVDSIKRDNKFLLYAI